MKYCVLFVFLLGSVRLLAQLPPGDWSLVWHDEFDGNIVDETKWAFRGEGYRTTRNHNGYQIYWRYEDDNVTQTNGNLVLANTRITTSVDTVLAAAVSSINLFERKYGYYEASIKTAPTADGCHTAFWLQSKTMGNIGNGGSDGAEVDILESAFITDKYNIAIHWDGYGADHKSWAQSAGGSVHDENYHTYGLEWGPGYYRFYFDGNLKSTYTGAGVSDALEYIILSTGASWGDGNAHTGSFPNAAYVDYVRVYEGVGLPVENTDTAMTILPTEDSYIYGADESTGKSHGNETKIIVKEGLTTPYVRRGYFKFDLSPITGNIKSAKLQLKVQSSNTEAEAVNFDLKYVSNDTWQEETLSWSNRPSVGSIIASALGKASGEIMEWDVTDRVKSELTDGTMSLQLNSATAGGASLTFYSKEESNTQDQPKLLIEYESSEEPTSSNQITGEDSGGSFNFYPNPVKDVLNINYNSKDNSEIAISILDASGSKKMRWISSVSPGENHVTVNLGNRFVSGLYFLQIHNGKEISIQKMLIQK
uniref:CBM96 family carbohydrate-binding protein n=1 Tax=uncultured Draconibacterium sp. TaxID=1573823 RepID=UPI00321644C7